jgi:hypothetical protein
MIDTIFSQFYTIFPGDIFLFFMGFLISFYIVVELTSIVEI